VSRLLLTWLVLLTILTVACGGGSNNTANNTPNNPPSTGNPPPPTNPGPQNLGAPNVITVAAGANTGGVDITVAAPVSNPAINALNLGTSAAGFASNTGVMVPRGSTQGIILFGPGITGDLTVTLSGPGDITVSNPRTIKSTNGTSGIAFDVNIPANAAPGARTVFLRSSNNDITAFTGGLEIQ
jgi:hypothetical protein